ncbi:hypothetical protein A3I40_00440 [Candidatus Uhrbacteria bacterium RIFCSPLOWO2_02_FULL_48_12]|uniref:AtpZ/AtpI family protein n=1 Tax=Candidatus Uhrbacteria bacterium RIFCSPLOWO2_02_FULL_48_12 TaxID=1802407 RepID=A0A1F7V7B3_9BACT|nr:MAG: hypothetical protein A3I40_00440 [Candidatus Uhrbacteria bacterium RIFCSPLOWO2_02_FULL_48_12]
MNKMPKNVWQALGLAWELGFIIAIPLVIFGSIGKYADGQLGTTPWLTLSGVFLAMATTIVWLYKQFKSLTAFSKNDDQSHKSDSNTNQ